MRPGNSLTVGSHRNGVAPTKEAATTRSILLQKSKMMGQHQAISLWIACKLSITFNLKL